METVIIKIPGNRLTLKIAMTVERNAGHKLEKCFDRQKFAKAEHFSGEVGGVSREGTTDVDMYSMEDAKPGFSKITQWTQPSKFHSGHHART